MRTILTLALTSRLTVAASEVLSTLLPVLHLIFPLRVHNLLLLRLWLSRLVNRSHSLHADPLAILFFFFFNPVWKPFGHAFSANALIVYYQNLDALLNICLIVALSCVRSSVTFIPSSFSARYN